MDAERWREYRTAIAVVSGMIYVLKPERGIKSSPDVHRVIGLEDIFAAVI